MNGVGAGRVGDALWRILADLEEGGVHSDEAAGVGVLDSLTELLRLDEDHVERYHVHHRDEDQRRVRWWR